MHHKSIHVHILNQDSSYLFPQFRLAWHLELHFTFALKHLQRFVWHFRAPLQLHFTNPCPPAVDCAITVRSLDSPGRRRQVLRVVADISRIGYRSNGHLEFRPLPQLCIGQCPSIHNDAKYVPWVTAPTIDKRYWDSELQCRWWHFCQCPTV